MDQTSSPHFLPIMHLSLNCSFYLSVPPHTLGVFFSQLTHRVTIADFLSSSHAMKRPLLPHIQHRDTLLGFLSSSHALKPTLLPQLTHWISLFSSSTLTSYPGTSSLSSSHASLFLKSFIEFRSSTILYTSRTLKLPLFRSSYLESYCLILLYTSLIHWRTYQYTDFVFSSLLS